MSDDFNIAEECSLCHNFSDLVNAGLACLFGRIMCGLENITRVSFHGVVVINGWKIILG